MAPPPCPKGRFPSAKDVGGRIGVSAQVVLWMAENRILSPVPRMEAKAFPFPPVFSWADVTRLEDSGRLAELAEQAEIEIARRPNARRVMRLAKSGGKANRKQIAARVAYYGGRCYRCGAPYECIDHVIPVAAGGTGWPANLRPACNACNLDKHARTDPEARQSLRVVRPLP